MERCPEHQRLLALIEEQGLMDKLPEGFLESIIADQEKIEADARQRQEQERASNLSRTRDTNAPYNSPALDHTLVKLLDEKDVKIEDAAHALKNVALVGVLLPDTSFVKSGAIHAKDLWRDDRDMITGVIKTFSDAGIPLHPKAEFSIYNLLPPVSSDFLMSAHPCAEDMNLNFPDADIVMISYILNDQYGAGPSHPCHNTRHSFPELTASAMVESIKATDALGSVSALHCDENIWAEASYNLGAKFIVARGGVQDEISSKTFEVHDDSAILIHSDPRGSSSNIGIIGRKDALPEYANYAIEGTTLGDAIHNALD